MKRKTHAEYIAEWITGTKSRIEAKEILKSKKTIYDEEVFRFDEEIDDVLLLANAGDNLALRRLLEFLGGKEFLADPDNDIFYDASCGSKWMVGHIDTDKLEDYHKKFHGQYMNRFNILTVYEDLMDNEIDCSTMVYVIDFNKRMIFTIDYEQRDEGDEQNLKLLAKVVTF